jgi:hypothetical protein
VFPLPTNGGNCVGLVFGICTFPRWNQAQANTGHDRRLGQKMLEMQIRSKKQIYSLYHQLQDAPIGTSIRAMLVELGVS